MTPCPAGIGRLIYQGFFEPDFIPLYDHPENRTEARRTLCQGTSVNGLRPGSRGRGARSSRADRRATSRSKSSRTGVGVTDCASASPTRVEPSMGAVPAADDSQAARSAAEPVNTTTREEVINGAYLRTLGHAMVPRGGRIMYRQRYPRCMPSAARTTRPRSARRGSVKRRAIPC